MALGKWGFNFGGRAYVDNLTETLDAVYQVMPGVALFLEAAWPLAPFMPQGCLTIARSVQFMDGFILPDTELNAYAAGRGMAHQWLRRFGKPPGMKAVQLENEPKAYTVMKAACWGAFHAGAADVFSEVGLLFCAGNWAMGEWDCALNDSHQPFMESCAMATLEWRADPSAGWHGIFWGYHGYTDGDSHEGGTSPKYLQQRPFELWKPALAAIGILIPAVVYTEDLFDIGARIETEVPGYKGHWSSERMARFIREAHEQVPGVYARAGYQFGCNDDWLRKGFETRDDPVVLAAMAQANREHQIEGSIKMPTAVWDPQAVMDVLSITLTGQGWNQNTAIAKEFRAHPEIYGVPISPMIDRPDWPFVVQIGSLKGCAWRRRDGELFGFAVTPTGIASLPL